MGQPWTPEQIDTMLDLKVSGLTNADIAERVGRTRNAVIGFFWSRGLGGGSPRRSTVERRAARRPEQVEHAFQPPSQPRRFSWEAA